MFGGLTLHLLRWSPGPNAVRVLRTIGVFDEILKKINPNEVRQRGPRFYDGLSDSNQPFFEVRPMCVCGGLPTDYSRVQYPTEPEDEGLGIHRYLSPVTFKVYPR